MGSQKVGFVPGEGPFAVHWGRVLRCKDGLPAQASGQSEASVGPTHLLQRKVDPGQKEKTSEASQLLVSTGVGPRRVAKGDPSTSAA